MHRNHIETRTGGNGGANIHDNTRRDIHDTARRANGAALTSVPRTLPEWTRVPTSPVLESSTPVLTKPKTHVTLDLFSPYTELCDTPFARRYINPKDIPLLAKYSDENLSGISEATRLKRLNSVSRRINERVYKTIMEDFNLPTEKDARNFYNRQIRRANAAVDSHAKIMYTGTDKYDIKDEIRYPQSPSKLVELFINPNTDPALREQIRNQFLLGHIAAELELHCRGSASEKLSQIQTLLDSKFYTGQTGETHETKLYGLFNARTNELYSITEDISDTPVRRGRKYKTLVMATRTHTKTGLEVFTEFDEKNVPDSMRKAIRKAQIDNKKGNGDEVRPDITVQDTHRMMVVVLGNETAADAVLGDLFDIIADQKNEDFFTNTDIYDDPILVDGQKIGFPQRVIPRVIPSDVVIDNDSKSDEPGKSDEYKRRRIFIEFQGLANPVEIIVQTLEEHVVSKLHLGTYDRKTGSYNGQAHPLMIRTREGYINPLLINPENHPELSDPTQYDFSRRAHPSISRVARELLSTDEVVLGKPQTL